LHTEGGGRIGLGGEGGFIKTSKDKKSRRLPENRHQSNDVRGRAQDGRKKAFTPSDRSVETCRLRQRKAARNVKRLRRHLRPKRMGMAAK